MLKHAQLSGEVWKTLPGKPREYPFYLRRTEEMQFPLSSKEHFVFVAVGEIEVLDPNTDQRFWLGEGECLRVTRESEKEFLNLRAQALSELTTCRWVII